MDDQERRIKDLENQVALLEQKLASYESNGAAKLYYSLNRKLNEMADLMNKNNLLTTTIDDPKDKTFDRLKVLWNDSASIAIAAKSVGEVAGITGDEDADTKRKPFVETIADKRY